MPEDKKPFDLKDLVARLKTAGLPVAEECAHLVLKATFDWIEDGVRLSDSKIDDFALAVMPPLRSYIDSKLDEISK